MDVLLNYCEMYFFFYLSRTQLSTLPFITSIKNNSLFHDYFLNGDLPLPFSIFLLLLENIGSSIIREFYSRHFFFLIDARVGDKR